MCIVHDQRDATYTMFVYYLLSVLYTFRAFFPPIIRSLLNCMCSLGYVLLYQIAAFVLYSFLLYFDIEVFLLLFGVDKFNVHGAVHR